ncbi:MAG TPA: UDP-N-acetylmuramate dehydrogenase [Polyangiaceae bacterium]|nr:UDP-N-acetylmuramate dehydrogenase [Polyangiaceae bacterium]
MLIRNDVPLADYTTLKLGGPAKHFVEVRDENELAEALSWARSRNERVFVLGGGSNLIVPDAGVDGLVVSIALRGIAHDTGKAGSTLLRVQAGEPWDSVVGVALEANLAGIESLSGIPGQAGATPIQNVGAYGQEVKDTIVRVRVFDREDRCFSELTAAECEFSYRHSRFKTRDRDRFIVTRVDFELQTRDRADVRYPELARALAERGREASLVCVRQTVLELRRSKSMLIDAQDPNGRSCGSFFLNPIVEPQAADRAQSALGVGEMPRYPQSDGRTKLSAAFLIEHSGFAKGTRVGHVGISTRHSLALVAHAGATSAELMQFASQVQDGVRARTGVLLSLEPVLW